MPDEHIRILLNIKRITLNIIDISHYNIMIISAGVIAFKKENGKVKYLLLKHVDGHWGFPKGKAKKNETLAQTAMRETIEETGLRVEVIGSQGWKTRYMLESGPKEVTYFLAMVPDKEVVLSSEHTKSGFFGLKESLGKLKYKDMKEILKEADNVIASLQEP